MPGIDACLLEAMQVPGARGARLVDWVSGLALGSAGDAPGDDQETAAAETAELARVVTEYAAFAATAAAARPAGTGPPPDGDPGPGRDGGPVDGRELVEDLMLTTRTCYHLVRFVDTAFDSSVFLHLWLDRDRGNLALARLRMQNLAERLVLE